MLSPWERNAFGASPLRLLKPKNFRLIGGGGGGMEAFRSSSASFSASRCLASSGDTFTGGISTSDVTRKIFFPSPSYCTASELASRSRCNLGSSDSSPAPDVPFADEVATVAGSPPPLRQIGRAHL